MGKLTQQQVQRLREVYSFLEGNIYRETDGTEISHMYLYNSFEKWKSDFERYENPEEKIQNWSAIAEAYRGELEELSDPDNERKGVIFKVLLMLGMEVELQENTELPEVDHLDRIKRRYRKHHPEYTE